MFRLFVAIDLPPAIIERVAGLCAGVPGARWVEPERMHLTLRFIGEVDGAVREDVRAELGRVSAPRFLLTLSGTDCFGGKRRARTLWAGIEPCPALVDLYAKVDAALGRAGVAPEGRKFFPHVTLARLKAAPHDRIARFLSQTGLFKSEPFAVEGFALYESHLNRSGAVHALDARYRLG